MCPPLATCGVSADVWPGLENGDLPIDHPTPGSHLSRSTAWVAALGIVAVTVLAIGIVGSTRAEPGEVAATGANVPKPADGVSKPTSKALSATQAQGAPVRPWMRRFEPGERPPQFVVFSFDGGGYKERWQLFLDTAKASQAAFTVFMTGTYFVPEASRTDYTPPGNPPGMADVAFSKSDEQLATLLTNLNRAVDEGHELGNHAVGHLCKGMSTEVGATWSADQWGHELDQFTAFFERARDRAPELIGEPQLADPNSVEGFRAPCLEYRKEALTPALRERGYRYDSSAIATGVEWPTIDEGLWEFPISTVYFDGDRTLTLDYNLWLQFNGGKNRPEDAPSMRARTTEVYDAVLDFVITGNRAPLVIANHFNNWSGNAFNPATADFMAAACPRADVQCVPFTTVVDWLELQTPGYLDAMRAEPTGYIDIPTT